MAFTSTSLAGSLAGGQVNVDVEKIRKIPLIERCAGSNRDGNHQECLGFNGDFHGDLMGCHGIYQMVNEG